MAKVQGVFDATKKKSMGVPRAFVKKGQLPVNQKKQWKAIRDREAFRNYKKIKKHQEKDGSNKESAENTNNVVAKKARSNKGPKETPFAKERRLFEEEQQRKQEERKKIEEERQQKKEHNMKREQERKKTTGKLQQHNKKGQPIMKNILQNVLSKLN